MYHVSQPCYCSTLVYIITSSFSPLLQCICYITSSFSPRGLFFMHTLNMQSICYFFIYISPKRPFPFFFTCPLKKTLFRPLYNPIHINVACQPVVLLFNSSLYNNLQLLPPGAIPGQYIKLLSSFRNLTMVQL